MRNDDALAVHELSFRSFTDLGERLHEPPQPPPPPEHALVRIHQLIDRDPGGAWVAEHDGQLAGAALAIDRDGLWGLSLLVVDPGHQSAGLGRTLLARSLEYAGGGRRGGVILASPDHARPARLRARRLRRAPVLARRGPPEGHRAAARRARRRPSRPPADRARRPRVRGVPHGSDIEAMLRAGCRLLVCRGPRLRRDRPRRGPPAGRARRGGGGRPAARRARRGARRRGHPRGVDHRPPGAGRSPRCSTPVSRSQPAERCSCAAMSARSRRTSRAGRTSSRYGFCLTVAFLRRNRTHGQAAALPDRKGRRRHRRWPRHRQGALALARPRRRPCRDRRPRRRGRRAGRRRDRRRGDRPRPRRHRPARLHRGARRHRGPPRPARRHRQQRRHHADRPVRGGDGRDGDPPARAQPPRRPPRLQGGDPAHEAARHGPHRQRRLDRRQVRRSGRRDLLGLQAWRGRPLGVAARRALRHRRRGPRRDAGLRQHRAGRRHQRAQGRQALRPRGRRRGRRRGAPVRPLRGLRAEVAGAWSARPRCRRVVLEWLGRKMGGRRCCGPTRAPARPTSRARRRARRRPRRSWPRPRPTTSRRRPPPPSA